MPYVIAFQVLCGFFAAHVASRKGRSGLRWWFLGALIPVFGVVLSLALPERPGPVRLSEGGMGGSSVRSHRHRPKRCCGSYIPDCHGCPYFRRQLFDSARSEGRKGHCEFYHKDLTGNSQPDESGLVVEDG
jgi:hypothetical protein